MSTADPNAPGDLTTAVAEAIDGVLHATHHITSDGIGRAYFTTDAAGHSLIAKAAAREAARVVAERIAAEIEAERAPRSGLIEWALGYGDGIEAAARIARRLGASPG